MNLIIATSCMMVKIGLQNNACSQFCDDTTSLGGVLPRLKSMVTLEVSPEGITNNVSKIKACL